MKKLHRRNFLKQAAIITIGFSGLYSCIRHGEHSGMSVSPGYGKLIPDPKKYLNLPKGFSYRILSKAGDLMDDGFYLPARPDGMATFAAPDGKVIILRNHENSPNPIHFGAFGKNYELLSKLDPGDLYDYGKGQRPSLGGTTTMVYNEATGKVEKQFLSLAGTNRNCAGGSTPWGTWITCEEDVSPSGNAVEKDHGYCFEVPATTQVKLHEAHPLTAMGRFNHEAVCVDPATGIVYLTEDRPDGLIYRFIPKVKGKLIEGGRLQVLAFKEHKGLDTRNWGFKRSIEKNKNYPVYWLDIEEVLSPKDDLRYRGYQKGAARFARGEGMWFGKGELYFACTNGGPRKLGQVFRYTPSAYEGQVKEANSPARLELFAESQNQSLLVNCDNLTVAPWGDVFLCEDNGGINHIRAIQPDGSIYTFAANVGSDSEFAGICFSPSGKTLFVNIQENGDTLAITGDWTSPMR